MLSDARRRRSLPGLAKQGYGRRKSVTIGAAGSLSWPSGFWPGGTAPISKPGSISGTRSIFLSFVIPLGAIPQRRCKASPSELSSFGKVSGALQQSCETPSSSVSPIARYFQEHADRFWRLAYLNRILIAGYADEGVSFLMRAERADVFNLNVAFSSAPVSYHDPVFTHFY
jgi:hypothetical protein